MRYADCHGDRKHFSKGMCQACYKKAYYKHNPTEKRYAARKRLENPAAVRAAYREADLRRRYGLTPERYERLLDACGYVCAVCWRKPKPGKLLAVDHDHATGKIRGLLCDQCNLAIGLFSDSPTTLRAAALYLEGAPPRKRLVPYE